MLALTDSALKAVRQVLTRTGESGLRIEVASLGCFGLDYHLDLDHEAREDDEVIDCGGFNVFVDSASWLLLEGTEVDFDEQKAGFIFHNPQAASRCRGCDHPSC